MTEMLTGAAKTVVRDETASARVLNVLNRVADGSIESTDEISDVYGDVQELTKRAREKAEMFAELGIEVSPYVAHLDKLGRIEQSL